MKIIDYKDLDESFFQKIEFENIESVSEIINDVRRRGDEAVKEYHEKFGGCRLENLRLSEEEIQAAVSSLDKKTLKSIKASISNVKEFAEAQLSSLKNITAEINGNILGHKLQPVESVCCYIPGGNYPLLSTAVMTIVPAKTAGVKRIIAMSPDIKPAAAAAAHLAGADEIYRTGGVQGIAAAAYGVQSIKKVNMISGPGNKYVTAAKKYVFGECGIDFLAGPSEVLIIADETADPEFIAADMLAQCEHDKDARAYLICFDRKTAEKADECARRFLETLKTKDTAAISYDKSYAVIVNSIDEAVKISDERAPEHLELCLKDAVNYADEFNNYGSLFIGNYSAEVFGDYVSGTNHTLPTNQAAKYTGGLSVFNYLKVQTYQIIQKEALEKTAQHASILAEKEGLYAHKLAADIRLHKQFADDRQN